MRWHDMMWYMWRNYLAVKIFNPLLLLLRQLGQPRSHFRVGDLHFGQLDYLQDYTSSATWHESLMIGIYEEANSRPCFVFSLGNEANMCLDRGCTWSLPRTTRACSLTRREPASTVRLVKTNPRPLPSISSTLHTWQTYYCAIFLWSLQKSKQQPK